MQTIAADPERLQWLDDRMTLIHALKRKYGESVPDIIAFGERATTHLGELSGREEALAKLQAQIEETRGQLQTRGKKLRAGRQKAADKMATAVTDQLRDLGFEHGIFSIALEPREAGPTGIDAVEFGFAPNLGEPMRPLRAIASSGEISRVMLAIKTVLADHDRIPILVFDEIDANVGGETANAVGNKLATVAATHQVLCITHLPQVAVHGTTHFVVSKGVDKGRTRTMIAGLADEDRTTEVARMLGGKDLTSVTMDHAREMLSHPRGK
jgi:DNA repair protein RecN (Recombination protein N)